MALGVSNPPPRAPKLRRMAGLVSFLVFWVLAAGGRLPKKARLGRFFIVV